MAGHVQANLREHFAVTGAHSTEMTLQGAHADLKYASGTIEGCVTVSQRRDNNRSDRLE
jgi:hypothetical protein